MGRVSWTPSRFRVSPDALATRMDIHEIVLVHLKTDRILVLNRTAAHVWDLLVEGRDLAEIRRRLLEEFDVPEDRLSGELEELFASLTSEQLISPDGDD
jgi:hypothetical protein